MKRQLRMLAIFVAVCAIQTAAFGQSCNPAVRPSSGCLPLYEFQGGTDGDDFELALKVTGADPGDFAETNTFPISPATVMFTPAASGKRSGKIELADTMPGSPQSITLTGSST
ncbi:MAG: hypothetical protein ABSG56_04990 [Bryobacteraceae bacterium]|jgi:hypothetical protein